LYYILSYLQGLLFLQERLPTGKLNITSLPSDGVAVGSLWGHSLEVPARNTKHTTQVFGPGKKGSF
jgi:hypothetical protein